MKKTNLLKNIELFANTNISDIGKFLIKLISFIFKTIQELITNNLDINDVNFLIKNKDLHKTNSQDYKTDSDNFQKIQELDLENNNLKNQIIDLNNQLSGYKDKISEISVEKKNEIESLNSKIGIQDKQITEFKKILQVIQQKSNEKKTDIKVI